MVGGGIVGLAVARELRRRHPGSTLAILEKERGPGSHQTGHNSGVIHSGVYYKPGSLKATLCLEGRRRLLEFCDGRGIPYRIDGKLIVALEEDELPRLNQIFERGKANGVEGLELLEESAIRDREPHARGRRAIWVPSAGVVDYGQVAFALAADVRDQGGAVLSGVEARAMRDENGGVTVETSRGPISCGRVIACAGLQSDRVAAETGDPSDIRIVPFRGDYYRLRPDRAGLIRSMIYPVPDPRFPFLGVHFTRGLDGSVLAGPNAVLALSREGYGRLRLNLRDAASVVGWPGFWRLARRHWRTGTAELWRDSVKAVFLRDLRRLVPKLRSDDLLPGPCGIRAQAVARDGTLIDDFVIRRRDHVTHVLNAPSPAATSSLAIAREVLDRVEES